MNPKHSFMVWLATLGRLRTKDRLRMGDGDLLCVFCTADNETHTHLFFQCNFVREAWNSI